MKYRVLIRCYREIILDRYIDVEATGRKIAERKAQIQATADGPQHPQYNSTVEGSVTYEVINSERMEEEG